MSEPCRHEREFAGTQQDTLTSFIKTSGELVKARAERDEARAALGRIGRVLFEHSHADTCATELSPGAGYECSCWRAGIYAALEPTQPKGKP